MSFFQKIYKIVIISNSPISTALLELLVSKCKNSVFFLVNCIFSSLSGKHFRTVNNGIYRLSYPFMVYYMSLTG